MSDLAHSAVAELLAAYAIDAVDDNEATSIEDHVASCAVCRAELDELRDTAGWLAATVAESPPPPFEQLAAVIAEPPPPLRLGDSVVLMPDRREEQRHPRRVGRVLLAAAAVVALVLAGAVIFDGVQRSQTPTISEVADEAASRPGSRTVTLRGESAAAGDLDVVITKDGEAFVRRSGLDPLGDDRTYQMWAVVDGQAVSVAILGNDPSASELRVPSGAAALAVTDEVSGGVVASEQTPVVQAALS